MRSFEDNTEAGGVAKAGKRVPMQEKPDRLFANTAGDEVYYDGRVDGDLVVAPTIRPGRYPGMHLPAHLHFNLWGAGYPVQWTEERWFEGDSYLTEAMKSGSKARGKFATMRPVSRDKDGIYHCEINFRLQERSNYPGP